MIDRGNNYLTNYKQTSIEFKKIEGFYYPIPLLMKSIIIILFYSAIAFKSSAQDRSKAVRFSAGTGFTSVPTVTIVGMDTSYNNSLSIAPVIEIRSSNGLGIFYSPKFVAGGTSAGIYVHEVTAGLESYDKEMFDVVADYSHYFFTNNKSLPSTPITNELYLSATYKKLWLMPTLTFGYGFGNLKKAQHNTLVNDVNLSAAISHIFEKELSDASLSLIPSLKLNAGTNEYFSLLRSSKYISANKNYHNLVKKKKGNVNVGANNTQVSKKNFSLNNAEAALQASFDKGSFNVRPSVATIFPFSATDNAVSFLWQIDLRYYF